MHYVTEFLINPFRQYPEIAIFLTLALGFWFGSLKFRSFSLGAVTSTLIAGLLVGQLHIPVAPVVQSTFFLMFLFAIGYSVGPQFFRALKKDGLAQIAFALLVFGQVHGNSLYGERQFVRPPRSCGEALQAWHHDVCQIFRWSKMASSRIVYCQKLEAKTFALGLELPSGGGEWILRSTP